MLTPDKSDEKGDTDKRFSRMIPNATMMNYSVQTERLFNKGDLINGDFAGGL
jgi:hypothetical protein